MVYRRRYYPEARARNCSKTSQTPYRSGSYVPRWEKEFCLHVGRMQWKDLLEAKKYISETDRIMQWDDSEGKECFYNAKDRFWALNYGRAPYWCISLPNPDKYIDEIDWNSVFDTQLLMELEEALKPVPCKEENSAVDNPWMLPVEKVKPTGWDMCEDWDQPKLLTGMIVGDGKD